MKLIVAYIQPFLVDKIVQALHEVRGVSGATLTHARGFGRGRLAGAEEEEIYGTSARVRVEVAANDDCVTSIVQQIAAAAQTGNRGDGKILVLPIEKAIRIQTGEEGQSTL